MTDDEIAQSYSVAAPHVNRFVISFLPAGARIAFAECGNVGMKVEYRSAVLLSYRDAAELHSILGRLLAEAQAPSSESRN